MTRMYSAANGELRAVRHVHDRGDEQQVEDRLEIQERRSGLAPVYFAVARTAPIVTTIETTNASDATSV